jgi:hypothetical protein
MKRYYYPLMIFNLLLVSTVAQELPLGYILQYKQDFTKKSSLSDFNIASPESWNIHCENQNYYLELSKLSSYNPAIVSPKNIGILPAYIFGDFILEADLKPAGKKHDSLDICILFGLKDSLHYYYVHFTTHPVDSQNVYIVNNADQKAIAKKSVEVQWANNKWHKVRIERNIVTKTIIVFIGNMSDPVINVKDRILIMGYIGFGSFEGKGTIDNINIFARTAIPGETVILKNKKGHEKGTAPLLKKGTVPF